jgi:hypothetical protein
MLEGGGKARAGVDFQVVNVGLLMDDRVRSPRRKRGAGGTRESLLPKSVFGKSSNSGEWYDCGGGGKQNA